ncbi:MAG: hypothetical protein RIR97_2103, partial [Pseudomonadota bacterium]
MRHGFWHYALGLIGVLFCNAGEMSMASPQQTLPIVFVHGDSDTAGHWFAQMQRFASNGYPLDHLFAVDIPHPSARADDSTAEQNRSSTQDAAEAVAREVDRALSATGADKVVLIGNSRGCQTARNYEKNFGGRGKVAKMILTGCVHNGVFVSQQTALGSEYNGAGHFLTALNQEPVIPPDVDVITIRSDKFDLYSQPDGRFIGSPGTATGANYESPELKGADNRVLSGVDHRETGYSPAAFAIMYKAITGHDPQTKDIIPETDPVLSGKVSAQENSAPTNRPLVGAKLDIYETDPDTGSRKGGTAYSTVIGEDGRWGPFQTKSGAAYEFVITSENQPVTRIFRSPFLRSSDFIHIRLYPAPETGQSRVHIMRPRGYFGPDDKALANGKTMPGIPTDTPVPHVWQSTVAVDTSMASTVRAEFEGEKIAARYDPDQPDS